MQLEDLIYLGAAILLAAKTDVNEETRDIALKQAKQLWDDLCARKELL